MSKILEVDSIYSGYGKIEILHGVSMSVEKGEVACLIGPNGCGKSTVFKTVVGLLKTWKGKTTFDGGDITNTRPNSIIRSGLSYIPQGRSVFTTMTVQENLEMGAFIRNDKKVQSDIEEIYGMFPVLKERRSYKAGLLSGGEQQMLVMGRALVLHPKLLLMDEPSLGLEPKFVQRVFEKIKEVNEGGVTIVIIEQNARRALQIADHAFVLDLGVVRFKGTGSEILANKEVEKLYLGG